MKKKSNKLFRLWLLVLVDKFYSIVQKKNKQITKLTKLIFLGNLQKKQKLIDQ